MFSAFTALIAVSLQPVFAGNDTWTGLGSDANWATAGNWSPAATPAAGDSLFFDGSTQTSPNNNFTADTTFDGLTFNSTASAFTLAGNNVLLFGAVTNGNFNVGVTNSSSLTQTINLNLDLSWGICPISSPAGTLALDGQVTPQAGALAYFGANLTTTSLANDGTGLISGLDGAGLRMNAGGGLYGLAAVNSGSIGDYVYSAGNIYTTAGAITSGAANNVEINPTANALTYTIASGSALNTVLYTSGSYASTFTISGTLHMGLIGGFYMTDGLTSAGGSPNSTKNLLTIGGSTSYVTAGGTVAGTPGTLIFAINGTGTGNSAAVTASITNNGTGGTVTVIKTGSGSMYFNIGDGYSGGTYIDQGYLQANVATAANGYSSFGSGPVYIASGATAYPNNGAKNWSNNFYLSPGLGYPGGGSGYGNMRPGGGALFAGTMTLQGSAGNTPGSVCRINLQGADVYISGQITGTGGLEAYSDNGSGSLVLTNASANSNNWTGGLIIDENSGDPSSVILGANNQLASNNVTLIQASTFAALLDLHGYSDTIGGLSAAASTLNEVQNDGSGTSTLALGGGNATAAFGGVISGAINLVKTGSGTQTLSGANTYTGTTTVNAGALVIGSGGSLASSGTTINGGELLASGSLANGVSVGAGALAGTGTIGGNVATTSASAQINQESNYLATANFGTLPISGNLDLSGGGACYLDLGSTYNGLNDEITVGGSLTLGSGTVFHINAQTAGAALDTTGAYVLIQTTGGIASGSVNPTPVWDGTPPSNSGAYIVAVSGRKVVLTLATAFLVTEAYTTPSTVSRDQNVLLNVMLTNGVAPYTVTVNASSIGGSSSVGLVQDTDPTLLDENLLLFTNTVALGNQSAGSYLLPVSANDSTTPTPQTGTANIPLTVAGSPLTWVGSPINYWATNYALSFSQDWQNDNTHSADYFYSGDNVTFDDSGSASPAVTLTAPLAPGSILMTNDNVNYAFTSSGYLTGTGKLNVMGAGQLELAETGGDNFSGGILVGNGSLVLSNTAVNMSGGITLTNGSLIVAHTGTISGGLTMNTNSGGSVTAVVEGSGTLNGGITAVGSLSVSNSPVIAGGLTVNGGSTLLDQTTTPSGNTTIASGATLQAGNNDANGYPPSGTILDNGTLNLDRSDSAVAGGVNGLAGPTGLTITGLISGNGAINVNGSGVVAITNAAAEPFTGTITIANGTLAVQGQNSAASSISGASLVTVNNGGVLEALHDNSLGNGIPALPITLNAGGTLTGNGLDNSGGGTSSHIRGFLTFNGGNLAMGGLENQSHASWEIDTNVTVLASSTTSTITASNVVPGELGGLIFNVASGTTPSGIDLLVTGSISNAPSSHDTGMFKMGAGTMDLDCGVNGFTNFLTISNGVLQVGTSGDTAVLASPLGSAVAGGEVTNYATLNFASSQGANVARVITGTGTVVVNSGVNTFTAANTYTGSTIITNTGTLTLTGSGSISGSTNLSIAAGATFDVSALASYTMSASKTLNASGAGLIPGSTAAIINGPSASTVSLGAQPINLTFTPTAFAGDSTHPSFEVLQSALTLNNNTFTINNAAGTPLGAGTYTVALVTGGTINQNATPSYPVTVTGTGLAANMGAYIQVSGDNVNLVVASAVPTAGSPTYYRANGTSLKISVTNLMSNASDPANNPLGLSSVAGGLLTNDMVIATTGNGTSIYYDPSYNGSAYLILTPVNNNNENFSYTVTNTVYGNLSATGTIFIVVTNAVGQPTGQITVSGNSVTTTWAGVVGDDYYVQRNTNLLSGAGWVNIWTTNNVPGVFNFTDTFPDIANPPPSQAYYRLQSAP